MSEFIEHKLIPVIKFKKMIQDCNNNNNNNDSVNNNDIEMKSDPEIKSVSQIRSKYNEPDIHTGEGLFKDKQSNLFWSLTMRQNSQNIPYKIKLRIVSTNMKIS